MIQLLELPTQEARALVATGAPVYLEINPIEYHGPHLPLRNDALISRGLALDLHARLRDSHPEWGDIIIATGIDTGIDVVPGPGAREATLGTLRELIIDACRSLVSLGARRVVLMSFHGGPLHGLAIHEGIRSLEEHGVQAFAPLNLVTQEMIALDATKFRQAFANVGDAAMRDTLERELATDFHAGFFETSMTLHYAPGSVAASYRDLPPCPPIEPERALLVASRFAGRLGKAELARELHYAAHGRGCTTSTRSRATPVGRRSPRRRPERSSPAGSPTAMPSARARSSPARPARPSRSCAGSEPSRSAAASVACPM